MKTKIGINGLGRIGRAITREIASNKDSNLEIVSANSRGKIDDYIYLLKYDSIHGKFSGEIKAEDNKICIGKQKILFSNIDNPSEIPWDETKAEIIIDSTGKFKDKNKLKQHIGKTVKKVIMCAPGNNLDKTFVFGINHHLYNPKEDNIISNASCTTNCLAPIAKIINDNFKIINGFMTTIHSYTSDQRLLDSSHKDFRRTRAATLSMIPTTTGAARSIGIIIPELDKKLDGISIRVPTPNVSMVDLSCVVEKKTTTKELNELFMQESKTNLQGILKCEDKPLVSQDYLGAKESSCIDTSLTNIIGNNIKVISWYDNEIGFSNRIIDLVNYISQKL